MSNHELEGKIRELRQLLSLIEEAEAEAEAIKDAIKAHMGDSEELHAEEYKSNVEICKVHQNRHQRSQKGPSRCGPGIHPGDHCPPFLRVLSGGFHGIRGI